MNVSENTKIVNIKEETEKNALYKLMCVVAVLVIAAWIFWPSGTAANEPYVSSTPTLTAAYESQAAAIHKTQDLLKMQYEELSFVECGLSKSKMLDFEHQVGNATLGEYQAWAKKFYSCNQGLATEQVSPKKELSSQLHTSPLTIQK